MSIRLDRVRGSRRKKIENAIVEAGYIYQYSTNDYQARLKVRQQPRIDVAALADNMKLDKKTFSKNFNDKSGIRLDLAKHIINFLQDSHHINLKINFSDYN